MTKDLTKRVTLRMSEPLYLKLREAYLKYQLDSGKKISFNDYLLQVASVGSEEKV